MTTKNETVDLYLQKGKKSTPVTGIVKMWPVELAGVIATWRGLA